MFATASNQIEFPYPLRKHHKAMKKKLFQYIVDGTVLVVSCYIHLTFPDIAPEFRDTD